MDISEVKNYMTGRLSNTWPLLLTGLVGLLLLSFGTEIEWQAFIFLLLALSPWLAAVIDKLRVGDFELSLREQQDRQQNQIDAAIRFLIQSHVTAYELEHLRALVSRDPFVVELRDSFKEELARLIGRGLVTRRPARGFRTLEQDRFKDVKSHFEITDAGRRFLEVHKALQTEEERQKSPESG